MLQQRVFTASVQYVIMTLGSYSNVGPNVMKHHSIISAFKVVTAKCLPVGCSVMPSQRQSSLHFPCSRLTHWPAEMTVAGRQRAETAFSHLLLLDGPGHTADYSYPQQYFNTLSTHT